MVIYHLSDEIRNIIREEYRRPIDLIVSYSGFRFRILFYRYGYTPHYTEHIVDPRDGREKLVLAVPHTTPKQGTIVIYDPLRDEIEWEYTLPQGSVTNPHMAHMVTDINPITGSWLDIASKIGAETGDIVAPARDNTWVVIDRDTKQIKKKITPQFNAQWVHDIIPSKDGQNLIITDWTAGILAKITPSGSIVWSFSDSFPAKISYIETAQNGHDPSLGGDYIVVFNQADKCVREVKDDGSIVWLCGAKPSDINATWTSAPHSAFRMGLAELRGVSTVIGYEAGGGIVAVDKFCRPIWGIVKPQLYIPSRIYRPSSYLLHQTTHVFPTLRGTIGFVDWMGKWGAIVGEIIEIPYHQTLVWVLAHGVDPGDNGMYLDPPIETMEWDKVILHIFNEGDNPLNYTVYGTYTPVQYTWDFPTFWRVIASGTLSGRSETIVDASGYVAIRVFVKRGTAGAQTWTRIFVFQKR